MGANGQYDDRLTRQECRAIRRAARKRQGITPTVIAAAMRNKNEVDVTIGSKAYRESWLLRRNGEDWTFVEQTDWEWRL